mmetsp:Transcript_129535/g.322886  ORF Transcript_129535/g.322886 Transcript_129535/m.322886 type:complete len:241 (-) Transcript_129535:263-985(-)
MAACRLLAAARHGAGAAAGSLALAASGGLLDVPAPRPAPGGGLADLPSAAQWRWPPRPSVAAPSALLQCQAAPLRRTTSMREMDYIHEEDYSGKMNEISRSVDFRHMLEEGCFLFEGVAPHIIERLVFGQKVFASRGTLLIEEGEENSAVFILGYGELSINVNGTKVADVRPGQVVGLYTMLKRSPASASVRVESDIAYMLVLRHGHFMACLDDNPEVLGKMQILVHKRELENKKAQMLN